MGENLELSPPELKFRFELKKNIPVTLSLHNPGELTVAFKVKTTAPKKYCVRPSSGLVEPKATKEIQVIMQAQREYPTSFADCKDKFLVQSCIVGPEAKEASVDVFDKAGEMKQTKLRVVLTSPPKPPSPVPEGPEEDDSSPAKDTYKYTSADRDVSPGTGPTSDPSEIKKENKRLRDLLEKAERDKGLIKKRLDLLESPDSRNQMMATSKQPLAAGYSLVHLLALALLAFLLGRYVHF